MWIVYLILCSWFSVPVVLDSFYTFHLQGQFHLNSIQKAGDVLLGGLFEMHFFSDFPVLAFTSKPQQPYCYGFDVLGFRQALTMVYAVEEINGNSDLLPNVTLGYSLYDNCVELGIGFRAALSLAAGQEKLFISNDSCVGAPPVLAIVVDSSSTRSFAISNVLGLYRVPMVSYFATCSCLSDRQKNPTFFRTIPNFKTHGWSWVGLLVSDDDYGLHAARSFQFDLQQSGEACFAYLEVCPGTIIKSLHLHMRVVTQDVTGLQWIASEAWATATVLQTPQLMPYLAGTLGIAIRRGEIPGLKGAVSCYFSHSKVRQFWEHTFECKFWVEAGGALCTGHEDLQKIDAEFVDVSTLRPEYNVYKAVYALAHALDDLLHCEPGRGSFLGSSCATLHTLEPWQFAHYLQKVNFTTSFGDEVSFDENGDALPLYDVMNWLWLPGRWIQVQNVGVVKKSNLGGDQLHLDEEKIFWNFDLQEAPTSVCSRPCPPGTRRARRKGESQCCFDCITCSEGEISNTTGTVFALTSFQAVICIIWLVTASPTPHKNNEYHNDKIFYECALGSSVGFVFLLGYIGLLAILSFLLAFLARNLPDHFNEAKLITFSMLIFCAVWVAFVPACVNSPGKYADAVEVFAMLASSFGLLVALFGPKCYIILLRPDRNTKKALMGRS
uniref:G-protein coupled receptors family 3 profile domain-containing protein n=1 Tax=Neogobius melanostomus TaxID=47308 RepID=A0A8C6WJB5_9GOBI